MTNNGPVFAAHFETITPEPLSLHTDLNNWRDFGERLTINGRVLEMDRVHSQ
jgi:hypothetical protein